MEKPKILVVAGPTASGKTACAVEVALRLHTDVVSADSMQVYRGMDVLSAKPTPSEMRGVVHHLIGIAEPTVKFSAAMYRELALPILRNLLAQGKTPVLCGGTGLYIQAVTRPMGFARQGSEEIRRQLNAVADQPDGRIRLHDALASVDPETAARLHPNDVRRVVRALEIFALTGCTQAEQARTDAAREGEFDERIFALDWPREELYRRIDARVEEMLRAGLVEEVQRLMRDEEAYPTARQAIGYKEIAAALRGDITMSDAIDTLKQATRNYAKRQLTWFRRDPRVRWIAAPGKTAAQIAAEILEVQNDL